MLSFLSLSMAMLRNHALRSGVQPMVRHVSTARIPAATARKLRAPKSAVSAPRRRLAAMANMATSATPIPASATATLTTNVPSAKSELPELLDVLRITREAMTLDIPTSLPELASDGLADIVFGQGDLRLEPGSPWARENLKAFGQREANRIAAEVVLLAMQVHKMETQPGKRRASLATLSQRMTKNRIFAHWAREVGIVEELKRFGGPRAKPLVKTLAENLETFLGALSLVQGSSAPTFVLAPLILREYKRIVGFVDSPTADSDSVTDGARAPFKSWVPNTISATDYQDIQMALQDLNKPGGATRVRTPRAKRAVKEPAAVKTSAFSVPRAFETINSFSAFKTMYDVFVHMLEMFGDN